MKAVRLATLLPVLAIDKCPVMSDAPIAEASSEAFDRRLAGTWRCMNPDDDKVVSVRVVARTPTVLVFAYEESGKSDSLILHSGKMGGTKFANVESLGDKSEFRWSLARLQLLDADVMQMGILVADLPDSLNASARKKGIERAVKENSFERFFVCTVKS